MTHTVPSGVSAKLPNVSPNARRMLEGRACVRPPHEHVGLQRGVDVAGAIGKGAVDRAVGHSLLAGASDPARAVEGEQPAIPAGPDHAVAILGQRQHGATAQSVRARENSQMPIGDSGDRAVGAEADPHRPLAGDEQRTHARRRQRLAVEAFPLREAHAIEPQQSLPRTDPEISVGVLREGEDRRRREPVLLVPGGDGEVGDDVVQIGRACDRRAASSASAKRRSRLMTVQTPVPARHDGEVYTAGPVTSRKSQSQVAIEFRGQLQD